jgi:hypothetical protein
MTTRAHDSSGAYGGGQDLEGFAVLAAGMILIVSRHVFTRKTSTSSFSGRRKTLLLLPVFLHGFRHRFREKIHMNMDIDRAFRPSGHRPDVSRSTFPLSYSALIYYCGLDFTVLMNESTLPPTKLPTDVYVVLRSTA